jgi:replicative DNA helicase
MERMLLAAGLRSRASFELIKSYITLRRYDRPFQIVWDMVDNYYQRDANAQHVQAEVLLGLIAETNRNEKHVAQFTEMVNEALAVDVSEVNVEQVVLASKKRELGDELAMALTNGKDDPELLEEYRKVSEMTSLDELNEVGEIVINASNRAALLEEEANRTGLLTLYPEALNQRLDGGVAGGDHIVVYARPETGKTALCLTMAAASGTR